MHRRGIVIVYDRDLGGAIAVREPCVLAHQIVQDRPFGTLVAVIAVCKCLQRAKRLSQFGFFSLQFRAWHDQSLLLGGLGMCFSAEVSFIAGAILIGILSLTVKRVRDGRELPYALIPVAFGVQQIVEGSLWLTFADQTSHLHSALTQSYQFFSHVVWPIFVPLAVRLLEPVHWRRMVLLGFTLTGAAVGLYPFYFLLRDPTTARVLGRHIDYISRFYAKLILVGYILATCTSSLLSSHRPVHWFGIATTVAMLAAAGFFRAWFISVWCFFAAAISVSVLSHFTRAGRLDFRRPKSEGI
jgi:hypothetical protein